MTYRKLHVFANGYYRGTLTNAKLEEIENVLGHCHQTWVTGDVCTVDYFALSPKRKKKNG